MKRVNRAWKLRASWELLLLVLLVLAIIMGSSLSPYFLSGSNFSLMAGDIMERAIMALPMTLIIICGDIDLSVASVLGLASVVLGSLWMSGHPLWMDISLALLVGLVAGLFNGLLVTRLGLPSLVVTLGTLALYRGLSYVILGDQAVSNFPDAFTNFGFGTIPGTLVPWSAIIFVVLAVVFLIILSRGSLGRQLYAIGINQEAARFAGINVARVKLLLFALSGVISAIAGIIFTARFANARPDNGLGFELDVVTIVLLGGVNIFGGRGTIIGVILSLLVIGIVRNALGLADVSGDVQNVVVGVLLVVSVLGPNIAQRIQSAITQRRLALGSSKRA